MTQNDFLGKKPSAVLKATDAFCLVLCFVLCFFLFLFFFISAIDTRSVSGLADGEGCTYYSHVLFEYSVCTFVRFCDVVSLADKEIVKTKHSFKNTFICYVPGVTSVRKKDDQLCRL